MASNGCFQNFGWHAALPVFSRGHHGRHLLEGLDMEPVDHPPQRVTYDADKTEPPETPQQQAAIITQLQEVAEPNVAVCSIDNPSCDGPGEPDTTAGSLMNPSARSSTAKRGIPGGDNSKPPPGPVKPYKGPMSQLKQKITALENDKIKIGVDLDRAGKLAPFAME
jgi:hypothetical protein